MNSLREVRTYIPTPEIESIRKHVRDEYIREKQVGYEAAVKYAKSVPEPDLDLSDEFRIGKWVRQVGDEWKDMNGPYIPDSVRKQIRTAVTDEYIRRKRLDGISNGRWATPAFKSAMNDTPEAPDAFRKSLDKSSKTMTVVFDMEKNSKDKRLESLEKAVEGMEKGIKIEERTKKTDKKIKKEKDRLFSRLYGYKPGKNGYFGTDAE